MELKIPPPLQALLFGTVMWFLDSWLGFAKLTFYFQWVIVLALFIFGFSIIALAGLNFKAAKTTVNPLKPSQASSLVIAGVYKISRNPMYLGLLVILLAWAFYLGNIFALAVLPVFVWYITNFQIKPEEKALMSIFGKEYQLYCATVRRWI